MSLIVIVKVLVGESLFAALDHEPSLVTQTFSSFMRPASCSILQHQGHCSILQGMSAGLQQERRTPLAMVNTADIYPDSAPSPQLLLSHKYFEHSELRGKLSFMKCCQRQILAIYSKMQVLS